MDCVHGIFQARVLEWVAVSFSRESSRPWDGTRVSCIAGRCFTIWATKEVWTCNRRSIKIFVCKLMNISLLPWNVLIADGDVVSYFLVSPKTQELFMILISYSFNNSYWVSTTCQSLCQVWRTQRCVKLRKPLSSQILVRGRGNKYNKQVNYLIFLLMLERN